MSIIHKYFPGTAVEKIRLKLQNFILSKDKKSFKKLSKSNEALHISSAYRGKG